MEFKKENLVTRVIKDNRTKILMSALALTLASGCGYTSRISYAASRIHSDASRIRSSVSYNTNQGERLSSYEPKGLRLYFFRKTF